MREKLWVDVFMRELNLHDGVPDRKIALAKKRADEALAAFDERFHPSNPSTVAEAIIGDRICKVI